MQDNVVKSAVAPRIVSVDILRGLVMILMALDHVRDFWGPTAYDPLDLAQTSPTLYFTRWITHFCAPVFVFLAGTSAFLYEQNTGVGKKELSRFLLTRGLWLVFIELTWVTFSWQFDIAGIWDPDIAFWQSGYNFIVLQVIWAIGWSMIFLAALVFLPVSMIATIGILMIAGHNLLDGIVPADFGDNAIYWSMMHVGFNFYPNVFGSLGVFVGYPLIPWIGLMAVGYAFGRILQQEAGRRDRILLRTGLGLIAGFIVLRYLNFYGDFAPWSAQERGGLWTFLGFMDVEKYPPSLLYLMITIGPALAIMPLLEKWRGWWADAVKVFGQVPFFYYVVHLPFINASGAVFMIAAYGSTGWWLQGPNAYPAEYQQSLLLVYAAWIGTIVILYLPCKWYAKYKRENKKWWLSYL